MQYVITISREFGSGGHMIAEKAAERLGIEFLDKKLIEQIASKTGIDEQKLDAHATHGEKFWKRNKMLFNAGAYDLNQEIFKEQKAIIREHAEAHSCLILGRSADSILADFEHVLNVYIYAPLAWRRGKVKEFYKLNDDDALALIRRMDAQRQDYRHFFGHKTDRANLKVDSSKFGIEGSVGLICTAAAQLFELQL